MDRAEIIKSNGFELSIDEDAPVNQRVQLTAMPVSKNTTFDVKGSSRHVYSSRCNARSSSQFARPRRASRSLESVRVRRNGAVLQSALDVCYARLQEERDDRPPSQHAPNEGGTLTSFAWPSPAHLTYLQIVRHMGEHKGWTCPHGRPTMRHLFSLGGVVPPAPTEINWDAFIE